MSIVWLNVYSEDHFMHEDNATNHELVRHGAYPGDGFYDTEENAKLAAVRYLGKSSRSISFYSVPVELPDD